MSSVAVDSGNGLVAKIRDVLLQPDTVLFVGSGISRWSGLPSWSGLIRELAEFMDGEGLSSELVRRELGLNELLQAASYGVDQLTPSQFAQFIRKACRVGTAEPHEIHRKIVGLVTVHTPGQRGGRGDRHLLCEAPEGPFRQKVPATFSAGHERLPIVVTVSLRRCGRTVFSIDSRSAILDPGFIAVGQPHQQPIAAAFQ
jgi:hypothetical protein